MIIEKDKKYDQLTKKGLGWRKKQRLSETHFTRGRLHTVEIIVADHDKDSDDIGREQLTLFLMKL